MTSSLHLAKKIIEEKFDEKISLASLCKKTGLNGYKLKKGFKELFGVSIREYQVQLKMAEAKRLLANTSEKISSIAYAMGYERHASFTLEFKKRIGKGPREWRKSTPENK
ncbi:MAG TPA: AraC family transcriptional regulator [Puia sp.]|jgi:AraC family transcriptional activator of pyochelin receptor|nr:AraC family transcriptional regulator [Puia sp.]